MKLEFLCPLGCNWDGTVYWPFVLQMACLGAMAVGCVAIIIISLIPSKYFSGPK